MAAHGMQLVERILVLFSKSIKIMLYAGFKLV